MEIAVRMRSTYKLAQRVCNAHDFARGSLHIFSGKGFDAEKGRSRTLF